MEIREKFDEEHFVVGEFKWYKSLVSSNDKTDYQTKRYLRTQIFTDGVLEGVSDGLEQNEEHIIVENGIEYKISSSSKAKELFIKDYSYVIKYVVDTKEDKYDFSKILDNVTIILNDIEDKVSLINARETVKQINGVYNSSDNKVDRYNKALKNVYVLKR